MAPRYHPACRRLTAPAAHGRRHGLPRSRAGPGCVYCGCGNLPLRFGQRLGEDDREGLGAGLSPSPARSGSAVLATVFPSSPVQGMLHPEMGRITVRVVPRSNRPEVVVGPDGPVVRVRSAAEHGKATMEAITVLAAALGVPRAHVRLFTGARSRTKIFVVQGLSERDLLTRLHAS